jgi:hypothetical protein
LVKELRRVGYRDEEISFLAHASMSETEDGKVAIMNRNGALTCQYWSG